MWPIGCQRLLSVTTPAHSILISKLAAIAGACAVGRSDPTEAVVSVFTAEDPCGLQLPTERAGNLLNTLGCGWLCW